VREIPEVLGWGKIMKSRINTQSYYSKCGYRMWGGERHVAGDRPLSTKIVSFGLVFGAAVAVATYFAVWG
jgi:hypothetical protein